MEHYFYYFLICFLFSILIWFNWKKEDLFSPPQIYSIYWFIQILVIVPILKISWWYYDGLYWILGTAVVFSFMFHFARGNTIYLTERDSSWICNVNIIKLVVFITFVGIWVHVINLLYLYQIPFSKAVTDISYVSSELYILRNSGGEKFSIISRLSLILLYSYPMLVGYYYEVLKKKKYIISGGILILYISLLQGTKAVFMTACILFFAGWLVAGIEKRKHIKIKDLKTIILSVIGVVFLAIIGLISKGYGKASLSVSIYYTYKVFVSYAFGHLLAFDYWFHDYSSQAITYGQYTFFGIFNALGIAHRDSGIFRDFIDIAGPRFFVQTNVYTVFRPIVMDFSPWGGLAFVALVAVIVGIAYKKVVESNHAKPFCITILVAFYSFLFWSFVTSIFAYASYICAFVYFYLCQKFIIWRSGARQ